MTLMILLIFKLLMIPYALKAPSYSNLVKKLVKKVKAYENELNELKLD